MVLTRSMATTNDIQEEEPPTTALEKQVKTLAAAVERLTKQNHDLEEQLRQKDAAPGNKELIKREPVLTEEIKKDLRPVTPRASRSDRT